jgi:RNA polymerase sigma factor (sigma-70 family)
MDAALGLEVPIVSASRQEQDQHVTSELERSLSRDMAAAQNGDAAAYRALLNRCVPVLAVTIRAQGLRGDAVEDIVQDALLAVHRARHTYDPARPFLPWLRAIARRRAIDALRRRGRHQRHEVQAAQGYEIFPDPGETADSRLEVRDQQRQISSAMQALPEAQRQALEQLGMEARSLDDAATATGRSKGALKVNLHRAIKALRASLRGLDQP